MQLSTRSPAGNPAAVAGTTLGIMLGALALLVIAPGTAEAYPQFQFSTGNSTCTPCHFSPVGGGLIADWGRDEAGDSISMGGDGRFLHGLWVPPEWLALGVDIRFAGGLKNTDAESESLLFPMQGDLYLRGQFKDFSAYFASGACCSAREPMNGESAPKFFAREFYVMYRPSTASYYVRAGRFYTPFGLRHQDHTMYVRRDNGQYLGEETITLSGGYSGSDWDVHLGLFTPDPVQTPTRQRSSGFSVLYENRLAEDNGSWGGHLKVDLGDHNTRFTAGALGKYWLAKPGIMLLAELDSTLETFAGAGDPRVQALAHLNATYFLTTGVMLGVTLEHYDTDLKIGSTERDSFALTAQVFPRAHFEVMALARYEVISDSSNAAIALLMLHYYL